MTGVQTCALPISASPAATPSPPRAPRPSTPEPAARTEAGDDPGGDPIARVQALFPGRIVAIEAAESAAETSADGDLDATTPDGGGDDGAAPSNG